MPPSSSPRIALIACRVLEQEIAAFTAEAMHIVRREFFRIGLVHLAPRRCPVVVPRAHDCVTLFLGSKERYAASMKTDPGLYWHSPGWNRDKRVPGPDREAQLRVHRRDPEGRAAVFPRALKS